jgi:hypothetical protein
MSGKRKNGTHGFQITKVSPRVQLAFCRFLLNANYHFGDADKKVLSLFLFGGQYNHAENKEWKIKVSLT